MGKAIDGRKGKPGTLRRGLMLYGSTAALAAALMLAEGGVGPALAQDIGPRIVPTHAAQGSFIATGPSPTPQFEHRSAELDIVYMNRDAVLNWTTYDTAAPGGAQGNSYVNFLPQNTELRFVGNGSGEPFTVLNRVLTGPEGANAYRGIAIQGEVTSYLFGDGPNSVGPVGGNVWFYSPGGILATGSASFNVGSLLLSASNISDFTSGFDGNRNFLVADFTGVVDPFASVIIQPGASFTLTQPNSSFAVIAPTIEQGGTVSVNGSSLYLSAVQGDVLIYDDAQISYGIEVDAQEGNRIRHTGTTTGPASLATDDFTVYDYQTIQFRTGADVEVLLSGSIGYAPATDAALRDNGSIELTAGRVVSEGNLTLNSKTTIEAPSVTLSAGAGETISSGSDANGGYAISIQAAQAVITAEAGGRIDIDGSLSVRGNYFETRDIALGAEAAAGNLAGGQIDIGGDLLVDATANSFFSSDQPEQGGRAAVEIGNGAAIRVGGDMAVRSEGYAREFEGETFARGGEASLTMTGAAAVLSVGGDLVISADALPFSNCECSPPSGLAEGGTARLSATGGTISVGSLTVTANAQSRRGDDPQQGAVTDATGGSALVDLGGSIATLGQVEVAANAVGFEGSFGQDGGAAFGGTASFTKGSGGSLTASSLTVTADATGGDGIYDYYASGRAENGGNAEAGSASIMLGVTPQGLTAFTLSAEAEGGDGGQTQNSQLDGGSGGSAKGGSASLTVTGAGTVLAGVSESTLSIAAYGGSGGEGTPDFDNALQSGAGGAGGAATAGALTVTAANGAEYHSLAEIRASAEGGAGGEGGYAIFGEGGPGEYGLGGDGGDATGGEVALIADGGTITGALEIEANGYGGNGGLHGRDANESYTGQADYGAYIGGAIALDTYDNGASRFDVTSADLEAAGDVAGRITVNHAATAPAASMRFGSFSAYARGYFLTPEASFTLGSQSGAITVDNSFEAYADSIALNFSGSGRLQVGGTVSLSSDYGDIAIAHTANPGVVSVDSGSTVGIFAGGNYSAATGSVVRGANEVYIRTEGSLTAADTRSGGFAYLSALGDLTLGNVTAGDALEAYAGRYEGDGSHAYDPAARATFTGTVSARSVLIESGGFADFAAGSQVRSDNDIRVRTGDDISVASGASLVSDIDPDNDESIHLLAGDINFGPFDGDLVEPIGTPIASLLIAGSLDTNGASLYLSGDAIDATGSTIETGNLTVDVTDAPAFGPYSNDGGLLSADCRQGNACLGSVTATGDVAIGLESNNGLVSLRTGAIEFSGDTFEAITLERLELNAGNVPSNLTAGELISLRSVNDAVALNGITLEAPELRLLAGTNLEAGTATLNSPGTIQIDVGNDIVMGTVFAGGGLDDGSESSTFAAPGDFLVDSLTYGGGIDMRVTAEGDLSLGFADAGSRAIDLAADGALFLGSTDADTSTIRLQGESVGFANLASSGLVYVTAGDGGITGFSEVSPVIGTTGGIALESTGGVDVGDLSAGTDIAISGATVTNSSLTAAGSIAVTAEGAVSVSSFDSGGYTVISGSSVDLAVGDAGTFLAVQATDGHIAFGNIGAAGAGTLQASGALSGGDMTVGGTLSLEGSSMVIGNAEGGAGVTADIAGDAFFAALTSAAGSIALDAGGTVTGDVIDAASDVSLSGGHYALSDATAGGDLTIDAFSMDAGRLAAGNDMNLALEGGAGVDEATAGGDLVLSAGNGITAGSLTAGEALLVIADTPTVIGEAVAGSDLTLAVSILDATSLVAGGAISVDANAGATIAGAVAGESFAFTGASLTAGDIVAGTTLDVAVSLAGTIDSFTTGGDAAISGRSLDLGSGDVAGNLSAQASEGALSFDDLTVAGNASLSATAALSGGDATSGGTLSLSGASLSLGTVAGDQGLVATAAGTASFTALESASGFIALDAGGAVTGGSAAARDGVTIEGASIALDNASFGEGLLLEARSGGLTGSGLYQGSGLADLRAAQGIAIRSVDTLGDIAMTAGAEARFVELRSRDGSVDVAAGGAITGSSVAAIGTTPGGDDNVTLTAGGAITLDGEVSELNATSRAQDDFTAQAGGALTIVGAQAGRDLALSAGAGTLSAANVSSGRDLSLTGPAVQLASGSVARNLTVRATAGDIAGSGNTTAGGGITLDASGNIAVGSLSADGGALTAEAGGSIGFTGLNAAGEVTLTAGTGISGSADVVAAGAVTLATETGATTLRNIESAGEVSLSGGGALTVGDITQNANGGLWIAYDGAIALGNAASATSVEIEGGAGVSFGSIHTPGAILLIAGGAVNGGTLQATNGIDLRGTSGAIDEVAVGEGDALLQTTGALSVGTVSAYNILADADGLLALGTVTAGQSAHLAGARVTLDSAIAGANLTILSGSDIVAGVLTAGDGLSAVAGFGPNQGEGGGFVFNDGNIAFASASAGDSAFLAAGGAVTGGALIAGGIASVQAEDAIALASLEAGSAELLSSDGAVSASGIDVDGLVVASGTGVTLTAPGALTVEANASAGGVGITAGGNLTVSASATGNIALSSTGGSVNIGSVGPAGPGGGIGVEGVSSGGGSVTVTAANAISVADSLTAGGALSMTAGGLVSLAGSTTGQTIAVTAGDLAIGAEGSLGNASTQRISLASMSAVNLGTGATGGFAVDAGEFTRIHSGGDLLVTALAGNGSGAGSLTVGSLTVNAGSGGQVGASGTFGLTAAGVLDVNNTLAIARAGSGNTLSLTGDGVDLDYANAALSVMDTANVATGRIIVNGRLITSLSAAAAADIVGKTPEEINLRLGQADTVREIGLFRTANLTLEGRDAILIQNSGGSAVDDRRGLTVGALTVTGAANGSTLVIINGVINNATGNNAAQVVTTTTPLAAGSSVNGCVLANVAACFVVPEPEPPLIVAPDAILFGTGDFIKEEEEDSEVEDGVADGKPEAPPIDTTRIDDPAGLPMIDDPVTGAGNEDLWQPPDE